MRWDCCWMPGARADAERAGGGCQRGGSPTPEEGGDAPDEAAVSMAGTSGKPGPAGSGRVSATSPDAAAGPSTRRPESYRPAEPLGKAST